MKFYRNNEIEDLAELRLVELEQILKKPLTIPIPIDLLAERVLELNLLWESIEELPGETILGALVPEKCLIILNENHRKLFEEKPGLERSTKGHEMGHWDLLIDKAALEYPTLFELRNDHYSVFRNSTVGKVTVLKALLSPPEEQRFYQKILSRADEPNEARIVNRYAAAISMPRQLLKDELLKIDRTKWPNIYQVAKKFEVTITALKVRMEQLDLIYVGKDGKLYESPIGQGVFPF